MEGLRERVAQRHARVQGEQHVRCGRTVQAAAEHSGEKRERHGGEREEEEHPDGRVGAAVDAVGQDGGEEQRQSDPAGDEHRPQRAPLRDGGAAPAVGQDREDGQEHAHDHDGRNQDDGVLDAWAIGDGDGAARASRASGHGGVVDERADGVGPDRGQAGDRDEPTVAPSERAAGVGQDQRSKRKECEVPCHETDGP